MSVIGFFLANIGIFLTMLVFAVCWNAVAWLRQRRRTNTVLHAYRPSRGEWAGYFWRRVKGYMLSYAFVLVILILLRRGPLVLQLISFAYVVPGLLGYFFLAGFIPAKFTLHPEGFSSYALIPFLPGRRERGSRLFVDYRVGFRPWRRYHDAVPQTGILLVKGETSGAELLVPRGQRDLLLNLAREGLKKAREGKRQEKKSRRV